MLVLVGGCSWAGRVSGAHPTVVSDSTAAGHAAAHRRIAELLETHAVVHRVRVPHSRDGGVLYFFRQDAPEDAEFAGFVATHDPESLDSHAVTPDELERLRLSGAHVHARLPETLTGLCSIQAAAMRALGDGERSLGELAALVTARRDVDVEDVLARVWALADPARNNAPLLATDVPHARRGWGALPDVPLSRVRVRVRRRDWAAPLLPPCANHLGETGLAVLDAREQVLARLERRPPPPVRFGYANLRVRFEGGTCVPLEAYEVPVGAPVGDRVVGGRVVSSSPTHPTALAFRLPTRDQGVFESAEAFLDAWVDLRLRRADADAADAALAREDELDRLEGLARVQRLVVLEPARVADVRDRSVLAADLNPAALERTIEELKRVRADVGGDPAHILLERVRTFVP